MKIAVFHNYLDNIGGAEMVSLILARELGADIYTTNIDEEKITRMGFESLIPRIFSIGRIPINAPFRQQLSLWKFARMDLRDKGYDRYIICGDWAISGAKKHRPNTWYVHSPIREIWDLRSYTRNHLRAQWQKPFFDIWVFLNRFLTSRYLKDIDVLMCNSENTKNRVARYLKRDAVIVNPPIETLRYEYKENGKYWLSVNRLITHKRIEMQLDAFRKLPNEKLIIVGSYEQSMHFQEYAAHCKKIKSDNVSIVSWVPQNELLSLYASCKGFITTSKDEDFGMSVVEAMASGKPVIAPNEGGYRETIIQGKTGTLIEDITADKLVEAIREVGKDPASYKEACLAQAKRFDVSVFVEKVKQNLTKQ